MPQAQTAREIAAGVIFAATYAAIGLGGIPRLRLDRAGVALLGAVLMVLAGALTLGEAYRAIDFGTLTLLLGVMIVVAGLRLSGLFELVGAWAAARAGHPLRLLAAVVLISGVFSAFLVNDMVCLVLTPLVAQLCLGLRRDPVPYLLAVAMASNAGSVATISGNPQNIIIGSASHIAYARFAASLAPVAACGLLVTFAALALMFRAEFWGREPLQPLQPPEPGPVLGAQPQARPQRQQRALVVKAGIVSLAMVIAFFAGLPPAPVAISAGALMLLTPRILSQRLYAAIDWPLLILFAGLFVVVAGLERSVLSAHLDATVAALRLSRIPALSALAAVLSNLVSNVPAVLVLKPFVASLAQPQRAWLALAMASTLAGNLTLVASIANLIVARGAETHGVRIGFWSYFRVGAPITVLTLLIGVLWL